MDATSLVRMSLGSWAHAKIRAMSTRILVVDDDASLAEMIGIMLEAESYTPTLCHDGAKALDAFHEVSESDVPIIMLTARTDTQDVVAGLEAGADDYVTKPFKSKELLARVSTRLRRTNPGAAEHVRAGDLDIDVAGHQVKRGESVISLTPLEFELLVTLARSPWKVFTREELLSQVWGYQHPADTRLVNVHVQRLRAKIEKDPERPSIVVTVRGVGYRVGESA